MSTTKIISRLCLYGIVLFTWSPTDDTHSGFRIYIGEKSKRYSRTVTISDRSARSAEIDLDLKKRWYATITAFNQVGESAKAKEITFQFKSPKSPSNLKMKTP